MAGIGHNLARAEPLLSAIDVFGLLRAACAEAGGQKAWAEAHGVAPQHLSDVLCARRELSPRILAALGLRKVERYARARIPALRTMNETQETQNGTA